MANLYTPEDEDRFNELLSDFSDCYCGTDFKILRFFLYDFLSISTLSRKNITGHGLLNELNSQGKISCRTLNILLEIADLTGKTKPKELLDDYIKKLGSLQYRPTEDSPVLSEYRKQLFKALKQVAEDELPGVSDFYRLHDGLDTMWDLVFYLETNLRLDNTVEKVQRFAKRLNPRAKEILDEFSKKIGTQSAPATSGSDNFSKTVQSPVPTTSSKEISEKDFNTLLIRVADWYRSREYINVLKVLFNEYIIHSKENPTSTRELFNMLRNDRKLTRTNLKILTDMIKVTNTRGVLEVASALSDAVLKDKKVTSFSTHRQNLILLGNQMANGEAKMIGDLYDIPFVDYKSNQWKLISILERKQLKEENVPSFIDDLKAINLHHTARIMKPTPRNKRSSEKKETEMSSATKKGRRSNTQAC